MAIVGLPAAFHGSVLDDVPEPELNYEGNAARKARTYAQRLNRPCLGDDTGIEIEDLYWLPGVFTARFGFERLRGLLLPEQNYAARFVCCVAYAEPNGRVVAVTATLDGNLALRAHAPLPNSSLPYSYFFIPRGESKVLAAVMQDNPEFVSHRGRALSVLLRVLA